MNRNNIRTLLKAKGVEDVDDILDEIMKQNGEDIENAKQKEGNDAKTALANVTKERDDAMAQLKAYEKGGEKFIDPTEFQSLRNFKTEIQQKEKQAATRLAFQELLKANNADEKTAKILLDMTESMNIQLTDDGKVKDGESVISGLKEKYGDGVFGKSQPGGGTSSGNSSSGSTFGFNFAHVREVKKINN